MSTYTVEKGKILGPLPIQFPIKIARNGNNRTANHRGDLRQIFREHYSGSFESLENMYNYIDSVLPPSLKKKTRRKGGQTIQIDSLGRISSNTLTILRFPINVEVVNKPSVLINDFASLVDLMGIHCRQGFMHRRELERYITTIFKPPMTARDVEPRKADSGMLGDYQHLASLY